MICRFLANYEYAASSLTFLNDIVLHSEAEKDNVEPLNATTIGKFVKDLFEGKIKKVVRDRPSKKRQIAYLYLATKTGETSQLRWHGDGASLKPDDILNSVQVPQGWLSKVNGLQQISFVGVEDWEFSRSRVILELALIRETELGEWKVVLKSHGCEVMISKEDFGMQKQVDMPMHQQLQLMLEFLVKSPTCHGFVVKGEEVVATVPHTSGLYISI